MANLLEGFAVSGEYVNNLKDKSATILKAPRYEEMPDIDNEGQTKRKLVLFIELSDKSQMDYYPNKTSQKTLGNEWSVVLDKWIGKRFEFEVTPQKVRGETKQVMYAKIIKGKKE